MSKLDLTKIREILLDQQLALAAEIQNAENKLQQDIEEDPDQFDLANTRFQQEIVVGRLSHTKQRLAQVQAALTRLDEGKYGICARCGNEINPERLRAIPYTAFCVNCQERFERLW